MLGTTDMSVEFKFDSRSNMSYYYVGIKSIKSSPLQTRDKSQLLGVEGDWSVSLDHI